MSALEDESVELLPPPAALDADEEVDQPSRKRPGRLRKAGQLEAAENAAPNVLPLPADNSPLLDEQAPPSSPLAEVQEPAGSEGGAMDEEEEADAAEPSAAQARRRPPAALRSRPGLPDALKQSHLTHPCSANLQEESYFDEEDELEEVFAKRATQKKAGRASLAAADGAELASADASEGEADAAFVGGL